MLLFAMSLFIGSILPLAGHPADAQDTTSSPKRLSLKLGALLPLSGEAKYLGSQWLSAGADYSFHTPGTTIPSLYLDYAGANKHGQKDIGLGLGLAARS